MPTPVISQPMVMASAPATAAIFCGKLKIPEPIIELSTKAVSEINPIFYLTFDFLILNFCQRFNILNPNAAAATDNSCPLFRPFFAQPK